MENSSFLEIGLRETLPLTVLKKYIEISFTILKDKKNFYLIFRLSLEGV